MYSFCTFPLSWINVRLSVCLSLGVSILQSAATFYHKLRNLSTCPICLASLPLLSTSPLTFCTRRRKIKIVIIKLWQKAIMKGKERKMEVVQSCLTLCDPVDCSLPGFSIHGILQARILEWVTFPSPGDLPDSWIESGSPALEADTSTSEPPGKPMDPLWGSSKHSLKTSELEHSFKAFNSY